jgi:hypothetical protein
MELTLERSELQWLLKPQQKQAHAPQAARLTMALPTEEEGAALPRRVSIPAEELVSSEEEKNKTTSLLGQHVTFRLLDGDELVATHALKLRECVPVLKEGAVRWTQPVLHKDVRAVKWLELLE